MVKLKVIMIASAFSVMSFSISSQASFAQSAIAPDNSLPINTLVNFDSANKTYTITGGRQVGANQFHSFQDFSVPTGNTAHFDTAPTTINAIARVTGANVSNIDGILKTNGTTNLYLINPNGIVFGANAKLDIAGSFSASTANSIKFSDGSEFSATNPQAPPLLNVNVPLGLQYGKSNTGATISNRGNLAAGQDLVLNADKLDLQGSLQVGRDLTLQAQDSVLLTNGAFLLASTFGQGNAGNITIKADNSITFNSAAALSTVEQGAVGNAGNVEISTKTLGLLGGSYIDASTYGQGNAGIVKMVATDLIKFDRDSSVTSWVFTGAVGNAGGVEIFTKNLEMLGGSYINASTYGQGNAGIVKMVATDSIKFDEGSFTVSQVGRGAVGNAGAVEISAKTLKLLGSSFISTNTAGIGKAGTLKIIATDSIKLDEISSVGSQVLAGAVGNAGGVEILTKSLEVLGGSFLSSATDGQGNAGTVKITATDSIKFDGYLSSANSQVDRRAVGNAGGVEISTKTLELLGSSFLSSSTFGKGNAGTIKITATNLIKFDEFSAVVSEVVFGAKGNAGGVEISTKTLEVLGGSIINVSTYGKGDAGTVKVTATDSIKFDGNDSSLTSQVGTGAEGNAGNVEIFTQTLDLRDRSFINTTTFGKGHAGTVKITATDAIKFSGHSSVASQVGTGAVGNAGGVQISAKTLELLGGSFLSSSTHSQGNAGTVDITATDAIRFDGNSYAISEVGSESVGKAGNVEISTKNLELLSGSFLSSSTFAQGDAGIVKITASNSIKLDNFSVVVSEVGFESVGNAGGVEISTKTLELLNHSFVDTSTYGSGNAGTAKITATGSIKFDGNSAVTSQVGASAMGNAGGVEISAKNLELLGVSFIDTSTFGQGNAGTVKITATDSIKFDGGSLAGSQVGIGAVGSAGGLAISTKTLDLSGGSSVDTDTFGQGKAGTVKITASDFVRLTNGARVSSTTSSSGESGKIEIIAGNSLILDGSNTGIFAKTEKNSTGDGGSIFIDPPLVSITNGAGISVDSLGKGDGGDLTIFAGKFVFANNSFLRANTASGEGGNISLQVADIFFPRHNSNINATAGGNGNGGNINLSAMFAISIPSENNDIFANASFGRGGNINFNTQGLFGLEFHPRLTPLSDITASSDFGLQGNVNINTLGVDPSKGLSNLPMDISDASKLVKQRCFADRQDSAFVITGRGGIPVRPADVISGNSLQENLGNLSNQLGNQLGNQLARELPNLPTNRDRSEHRIIEAQGWTINQQGQVSLIADVTNSIPAPTWARQLQCR